jgi:hypothetical protein
MRVELPDNVKPNLGCDAVVSLPRDTEKSKLSIIKTTVYLKGREVVSIDLKEE